MTLASKKTLVGRQQSTTMSAAYSVRAKRNQGMAAPFIRKRIKINK